MQKLYNNKWPHHDALKWLTRPDYWLNSLFVSLLPNV